MRFCIYINLEVVYKTPTLRHFYYLNGVVSSFTILSLQFFC